MTDEPKKNDIDFDELDKAVTSLMGKVSDATLEDSHKTNVLDINTTLEKGEKPVFNALNKVAESIGSEMLVTDSDVEFVEDLTSLPEKMNLPVNEVKPPEQPETPEPPEQATAEPTPVVPLKPAVKRPSSGRFMDMVNPKADMRTAPLPDLIVPTRKGVTTAVTPSATPVVAVPTEQKSEETPVVQQVLSTPFLTDAKVEKRPLGSAAPTGGNITVVSTEVAPEKSEVESKDETPVVEIESINSENEKKSDNGSGDEQRALNPADFVEESSAEQALTKIEATEATVEVPQTIAIVESGDTESLKQSKKVYKNQSEPTPASDGAIFDTKDYHQAIAHPKKQKSGWGTVFVIVIIIILAIAVAGGAYLFFGMHA